MGFSLKNISTFLLDQIHGKATSQPRQFAATIAVRVGD